MVMGIFFWNLSIWYLYIGNCIIVWYLLFFLGDLEVSVFNEVCIYYVILIFVYIFDII